MVRRAAFTLIELIFAIVIIAISVISLPMMSQTISEGIDANIVQEAIFASATELNGVVTAHWDENSIESGMPDSSARVIETVINMCNNDNNSSTFRQMLGHINQPLHRRCLDANTTVTTPSNASATAVDSLDDWELGDKNITIGTSGAEGYKETYQSNVIVSPNANFNGANNANIKSIVSTVKDEDGTTIAVLRTYSANIGEVDYYKRNY